MTCRRVLVTFLFLVITITSAFGRDEVINNPMPDRTWGSVSGTLVSSGKSVGVIIGISHYYNGYADLNTTRTDSDKMLHFLQYDAGFDTIYMLTESDATKAKIDRLMTDVIPKMIGPHDRFLFYWSGHGAQMTYGETSFGFLPLADSKPKEFSTMISMEDIARWDRYLNDVQTLFVLDACLSGLAGVQAKASSQDILLQQLSRPTHKLFTAGTSEENVIAGDRWSGSLFTDSFILGAKGNASRVFDVVTLDSLKSYIVQRVITEKQIVGWNHSLTPQLNDLRSGEGTFFFKPAKSQKDMLPSSEGAISNQPLESKAQAEGETAGAFSSQGVLAQKSGDYNDAARLYKLAADQGDARGQSNLGVLYEIGLGGLPKDDIQAARLYKIAADQGNADGQVDLGLFYASGRGGLPKDDTQAARLFRLAADQGNAYGQLDLGFFYENGLGGLPKDDTQAARLYKLAADHGDARGQATLGFFYENGRGGLLKDDNQAARLYKLAADQGNAYAQVHLGVLYEIGLGGLPKDDIQAARLYKIAADQGNADAQLNLGNFYVIGLGGLPKDDTQAARLYKLAADQGNAYAQINLGVFYEYGLGGLPKDGTQAVRLYKLAADQGNADAQVNLGDFYANGLGGMRKDVHEAGRLYRLAAEQGNYRAQNALKHLN